jgi:hypothetical protein
MHVLPVRGETAPAADAGWHSFVELVIAPHPGLTASRSIAIDYGIRGGSLRVRRALLFYALRRVGLDVAADVRQASEQHIVLLNRAEVAPARVRPGQT